MKKSLLLLLMAWCACTKTDQFLSNAGRASALTNLKLAHRRIYLTKGSDSGLYLHGKYFQYSPGDTLVLKGSWNYCSLENFYGTPGEPVIIINEGSQVHLTSGFSFTNCRYIKVLGIGSADKYGFRVSPTQSGGVAVTITGRSSNIEISNVDVYNKTYGYWVKQEASCVDSLQFPHWIIDSIEIHDGMIRKVYQEGMYLGSTDPNGTRSINCNGNIIKPKPLRLGNIQVYNMRIDSAYRSGIQLSGADHGRNDIYNNVITNCGYEYNSDGQGSGISLGGYTTASVRKNIIRNTYTMGISSLGAGFLDIENNIVRNSGMLNGHTVNGMANIMIDTRYTNPVDSTLFYVKNNVLSQNTDDANIRIYKTYSTYAKDNRICHNGLATILVVSGIQWTDCSQ